MVGIQVLSETMYSVFSTQHTQLFHVIHVCDAGNNDKRRSAEYYPTSIAGFFVACQCKDRYRSRALICDSGRDGRILLAHVVMATICHSFSRLAERRHPLHRRYTRHCAHVAGAGTRGRPLAMTTLTASWQRLRIFDSKHTHLALATEMR